MVELTAGDPRFREDQGQADSEVESALGAYAAGAGTEHAALTALASARLVVPVVAVRTEELGPAGGEKASEMAMPVIVGADGRRAVPAFTCIETLQRWQATARPVPVHASAVWQFAVQESGSVIVDIAGPVPVAVEGARLAALAAGAPVPHMYEDPDVWQAVTEAVASVAPGTRVRFGKADAAIDLSLEIAHELPLPDCLFSELADAVIARLPGRVRGGIAIAALPPTGRRR
jgi:hypothetical protein